MNNHSTRPNNQRWFRSAATAVAAATLLIGCSSDDAEPVATTAIESQSNSTLAIELARSPRAAADQTMTPVYGILVNKTQSPIRVISATSPMATSIDLLNPDGSVRIPADGFVVEVDGGLIMEPVGYKLMLAGVERAEVGDQIPVTLRLDSDETFTFNAIVQELDE